MQRQGLGNGSACADRGSWCITASGELLKSWHMSMDVLCCTPHSCTQCSRLLAALTSMKWNPEQAWGRAQWRQARRPSSWCGTRTCARQSISKGRLKRTVAPSAAHTEQRRRRMQGLQQLEVAFRRDNL